MRSEVMPTVMAELTVGESGHHFSGQYKTKDIRALVDKVDQLHVQLAGCLTANERLRAAAGKLRMDHHSDECLSYEDPPGACICEYEWNNGIIDKALAEGE